MRFRYDVPAVIALALAGCSERQVDAPAPPPGPTAAAERPAPASLSGRDVPPSPSPTRNDLVDILSLDPSLVLDVRYATENNFLKRKLYPVARVLLRRPVAERLARVQKRLRAQGLGLKAFDGYRPLSAQKTMWAILPDEKYVGDPAKGSKHNRGAAVDVSLVDAQGRELPMPTPYDDFTPKAAAGYADIPGPAKANRKILQDAMTAGGFEIFPSEWWHFNDPEWETFGILDIPLEAAGPAPANDK